VAADIVGLNFQAGNRIGAGVIGEHQVVIALIAVCLLRVFVDLDHPAPNDA